MATHSKRWVAEVALYGPAKKRTASWVLVDDDGSYIRARFHGRKTDKEQEQLAKRIAFLLNEYGN